MCEEATSPMRELPNKTKQLISHYLNYIFTKCLRPSQTVHFKGIVRWHSPF